MIKIKPWSYTFLRDLENCEHKAFRRFIARDIPYVETPESKAGIEAHKALADRLTHGVALSGALARFEPYAASVASHGPKVEWKLGMTEDAKPCSFFADDVWGRTVIDIAMIHNDVALLIDWKTGKVREDPGELEIQSLVLKCHMPNLQKITGRYVWLNANKVGPKHDLTDWAVTLAGIRNQVEKIRHNMRFGAWQKNENALCGWCPVKDCEFNKAKG